MDEPLPPALVNAPGEWAGTRTETEGSSEGLQLVVRHVLAGNGLCEEIRVPTQDYAAISVIAFAKARQLWVLNYLNNRTGEFSELTGDCTGDSVVWRKETDDRHLVLRYDFPSATEWRRTQSVSEDGGNSWSTMFLDELRRSQPL